MLKPIRGAAPLNETVAQALVRAAKFRKNGDDISAAEIYTTILERFPANKPAAKGLNSISKSDNTFPIKAPKRSKSDIDYLVELYSAHGYEDIVNTAKPLAQSPKESFEMLIILGLAHSRLAQNDQAIQHYEQALKLDPTSEDIHNNLGLIFYETQNIPTAITHFLKAIEQSPDYAQAYNNLGVAMRQSGKREEGLALFQKATELHPDYVAALTNKAGELVYNGQAE